MTAKTIQQGPLPKSTYTLELEALVRKLLKEDFIEVTDKGIASFADGTSYDLIEIFRYANLEHISLTKEDSTLYQQNYEQWFIEKPFDDGWTPDPKVEEKIKKIKGDAKHVLNTLTVAELTALNVYTREGYYVVNKMLRSDSGLYADFKNEQDERDLMKAAIITGAFAASGLARNLVVPRDDAYRFETLYPPAHNVKFKAAANKEVIPNASFLSTSIRGKNSKYKDPEIKKTASVYNTIQSIRGQDISGISAHETECEFLSLGQQLQVISHREEKGKHHVVMKQVTDVSTVHDKATEKFKDASIERQADLIRKGVVPPTPSVEQQNAPSEDNKENKTQQMRGEISSMKNNSEQNQSEQNLAP